MVNWASAIAEFAASTAALNARALHRAGLAEPAEIGAMHALLDVAEAAAGSEEQHSLIRSLRQALPPEQE